MKTQNHEKEAKMKKRLLFSVISFIMVIALVGVAMQTVPPVASADEATFLPPPPASVPHGGIGKYIPGGRNVEAYRYVNAEGYPPFPDRAKWVGTLSGSWYEMGIKLGLRSGDPVRCTSDIWWKKLCEEKGLEDTLKAMKLYESQIAALDPNQIDFLKGITSGAAPWLDQSIYSDQSNELYADSYWRVLAASIWDEWYWGTPAFPEGNVRHGCNSFAASGAATVDGKTIVGGSMQTPHEGLDYLQSFVIRPPKGNIVWTVCAVPNVTGLMLLNDKGLLLKHHFGGATNPKSLEYPGGPYYSNAFGVPWWNLLLYTAINADTAEEAIELLTVGPKQYLDRTGRKSLLRTGGWNWLVADSKTMAVVEATADRYAVRYAGEYTGADWTDKTFMVAANHFLCDFSYDENNNLTDVPMTIFNVMPPSVERFWTLMWDAKDRHGRIDKYMAQHIMSMTYVRDKETGKKLKCAKTDEGEWLPYGEAKWCSQGRLVQGGLVNGSNTSQAAVLDGSNSMASWTLGNPYHWVGAWDEYYFSESKGH
jgi:hypothetical protein